MGQVGKPTDGAITLAELREFASFPAATQRYIRRSLDIAFHRGAPMETWGRDVVEEASIRAQSRIYGRLDEMGRFTPDQWGYDALARIAIHVLAGGGEVYAVTPEEILAGTMDTPVLAEIAYPLPH